MSLGIGLICHSGVGGSARAASDLACELARRGHRVHVLARGVPPTLAMLATRPPGLSVHALDPLRPGSPRLDVDWSEADRAALAGLVARTARDARLDILHFHYALPFAEISQRACRLLGAAAPALVGTLHGTDVPDSAPAGLRETLDALDALTTVSHAHARLAVEMLGLERAPLVIPNAIDLDRFQPGRRRRPFARPRVLHVSNFRAVKDPARAAAAFIELRRSRDAELWLVGDGDEMPRVRKLLARAGLLADTRLLGLRNDVETIYPRVDAVLITSRRESFSLVALEAAACGVPVVAPRIGGLPENVAAGRTGVLYAWSDPGEPATSLAALLADARGRAEMRVHGPRHARAFALSQGAARYERLYREVLATRELPLPAAAGSW